jgi:cysteine desulfurase
MDRVYLDHNATTKPFQGEWAEPLPWGNPSSIYKEARHAKALIRETRALMADLIGCNPIELTFTSGGTESNNAAILGLYFLNQRIGGKKNHYLFSAVEHPSVRKPMEFLREMGMVVEEIPVLRSGEIDLEAYKGLLREDTALASVMYANNETGNIFPLKKLAKLAHEKGALFHCDAVQALGKLRFNLHDLEVDLASFSAHKFYAHKGVGLLYNRRGVRVDPLLHGGGQERGRRAGTENLVGMESLRRVALLGDRIGQEIERLGELRSYMDETLLRDIEKTEVIGGQSKRVANTSNYLIHGIDGEILQMKLDMLGFDVSTGSACSSGSQEPSLALRSMGLSRREAQGCLRISLGWETTQEEVESLCRTLPGVVAEVRSHKERQLLSSGTLSHE